MNKKVIHWIYAKDPNDFNEGYDCLNLEDNIISITYDGNHGCYVLFYWE